MKKYLLQIISLCIMFTSGTMVYAQDNPDAEPPKDAPRQTEYPDTGVRFVICTTTKGKLPVPLYVEYGDDYVPLHISARGTSERAVPKNGHVVFYEKKPAKDAKKEGKEVEKPFLDVPIPDEIGNSKAICLVLMAGNNAKPAYYFMKESDFPLGGLYVVNFSASKLEFLYTLTGDMPMTRRTVAPFKRPEDNCIKPDGENVRVVRLKDNPGAKNVGFVLRVPAEVEGGTPMPLRSTTLPLKSYSSDILLVVRHPKNPQLFSVISVVYNDVLEKSQKLYRENEAKNKR